ncbi:unnamed protein product [Paramecium sonneborni]|uniref:Uncharacterized protein n=1 Tax=Paramecium sonneborni TaxID=65129 RepID=A0A8S1LFF1_9CILI|nr:unnamed protein product [Paramecium sonneborni]
MIFIVNKILARFSSINPIQQLNAKFQNSKYEQLCEYMKQNNKSIGIKYMAKSIFQLKRELDFQSKNLELIQQVTKEMKDFMIKKKYDIRSYHQLTQLYKNIDEQEFAITIFPRQKALREKQKKKLALHELDRFDEYFNYTKLDSPALKHEEEDLREDMINLRLDKLNPLGLEFFAETPVQAVVTIETPQLDQVMLMTMLISSGCIEFKDVSVLDNINWRQEWHQKLLQIVDEYSDSYRANILNLSDPLQTNLVKYLNAFGFIAEDAYYLELLAILSEQTNYINWLNDLHNIVLMNQIHSA